VPHTLPLSFGKTDAAEPDSKLYQRFISPKNKRIFCGCSHGFHFATLKREKGNLCENATVAAYSTGEAAAAVGDYIDRKKLQGGVAGAGVGGA
jgi:hypothetical protein